MNAPEKRQAQKILADYLVRLIFDDESLARIDRVTAIIFGTGDITDRLSALDDNDKHTLLDAT
jgi:tyrosyl-tRNA synthetase